MVRGGTESAGTPWKRALGLTLFLRLFYSVFAVVAAMVQKVNLQLVHSNALTENLPAADHTARFLLLGVWERFDTLWYLHIAAHGYDRPDADVFFPLYPLLIRLLSWSISPMAAALLISTIAAFFVYWGIQELMIADGDPRLARSSMWLYAAWPAGFIFFAGYPESLLGALILWSIFWAGRNRWLVAAALGIAAALTKAVGVVVIVPLLVIALRQKRRRHQIISLASLLLIPAAAAAFLEYLRWGGSAGVVTAYARYWRTVTAPPWVTAWHAVQIFVHQPNAILFLNLAAMIVVSVLVVFGRLRIEYILFSAGAIFLLLCKETTPPLQSMMRYQLIIFPACVGAAQLLQGPLFRPRFWLVCAGLFIINLGLLWLFLGWSLVL